MDPLGTIGLSAVVIISLAQKGYTEESQKIKLTLQSGLVSATAQYFTRLSKGAIKYETIVIGVCVFSAFVSNLGNFIPQREEENSMETVL